MKVLLLCNDNPNQRLLAQRLHGLHSLAAIGIVRIPAPVRRQSFSVRAARALVGLPLRRAWFGMMAECARKAPDFPDVPTATHDGVNNITLAEQVAALAPELVVVSGTDLLKAPLIDAIGRTGRILNLHTGISPYIKGAPNCTNWALSLGEFDLIGNTVMWLDAGIDTGAIVATERTVLTGRESLTALHIKVMDHAHDLLGRAYRRAIAQVPLPAVGQGEIGKGRLFLSRHWTAARAAASTIHFLTRYAPAALSKPRPVRLIAMDDMGE